MSEREKLTELIQKSVNGCARNWAETIADYLLKNGIIVPPCERVHLSIHCLKIYEAKNLAKYGFYTTKEEALKALKGGAE